MLTSPRAAERSDRFKGVGVYIVCTEEEGPRLERDYGFDSASRCTTHCSSIQKHLSASSSETSHPPPARFSRTGQVHPRVRASRLAGVAAAATTRRILHRMLNRRESATSYWGAWSSRQATVPLWRTSIATN